VKRRSALFVVAAKRCEGMSLILANSRQLGTNNVADKTASIDRGSPAFLSARDVPRGQP
jgi:hypothetical protein